MRKNNKQTKIHKNGIRLKVHKKHEKKSKAHMLNV